MVHKCHTSKTVLIKCNNICVIRTLDLWTSLFNSSYKGSIRGDQKTAVPSRFHLSLEFVSSNIFYINSGTAIYVEGVTIIIHQLLSKSRRPWRGSVVQAHVSTIWGEIGGPAILRFLVVFWLVVLLLTCADCLQRKASRKGPVFAEPLYQWLQHISLLNLVGFFFYPFSERKTDPNSFKLVNSSHMSESQSPYGIVPPSIYRRLLWKTLFSKLYLPQS